MRWQQGGERRKSCQNRSTNIIVLLQPNHRSLCHAQTNNESNIRKQNQSCILNTTQNSYESLALIMARRQNQSSSSMTLVPSPFSHYVGISATVTREYISSFASSSSFLLWAVRTLTRLGTLQIPLIQMYLFNLTSTLTSFVPMALSANFLISFMALGAFFLIVLSLSMMIHYNTWDIFSSQHRTNHSNSMVSR